MPLHDFNAMQSQSVAERYQRKVAHGENMSVARLEVGAGAITGPHRHTHEEVIILLQGRWRFQLPTGPIVLNPNQLLTIPAGVEHSSEALEDVIAIDVSGTRRRDWATGEDSVLHYDPQNLWGV
jgi:quercetin dioxygenase-like cupin family protein